MFQMSFAALGAPSLFRRSLYAKRIYRNITCEACREFVHGNTEEGLALLSRDFVHVALWN